MMKIKDFSTVNLFSCVWCVGFFFFVFFLPPTTKDYTLHSCEKDWSFNDGEMHSPKHVGCHGTPLSKTPN